MRPKQLTSPQPTSPINTTIVSSCMALALLLGIILVVLAAKNSLARSETQESKVSKPLSKAKFEHILASGRGWELITELSNSQALALSRHSGVTINEKLISQMEKQEAPDGAEPELNLNSKMKDLRGLNSALPLISLQKLSPKQAKLLSTFSGHLILLWKLESLPEPQAKALAQYRGDWNYAELDLRGLASLPAASAKALANFNGNRLNLNGIKKISDALEIAIETMKCNTLSLDGLTSLSLSQAKALSRFAGEQLSLDGLSGLTTLQARELANFSGTALSLQGITLTDDVVISELTKFRGQSLNLNGLRHLSEGQAKSLSNFSGAKLRLTGLSALSDTQAQELGASRSRELYLDGITWLSNSQTDYLSRFSGKTLSLGSLNQTDISGLSNFTGENLYLTGLSELNQRKVHTLLDFRAHMIWLEVSRIVSDKNFATLRLSDSIGLVLPEVTSLRSVPLRLLMTWQGGLEINNVTELDELFLPALAAWDGRQLHLDGIRELLPNQAKALSAFRCATLSASRLQALTEEDIENLIQFKGKELDVTGWSKQAQLAYYQSKFDNQRQK